MTNEIKAGSILIEEGTPLPESLRLDSEPYSKYWKLVKNLDGYGLDRIIRAAGWNFFFLAGEVKASVFGFDTAETRLKAINRLLASLKPDQWNCLQITRVAWKRFLGMPYVSVTAHFRHIQESMFLSRSKRLAEWGRSKLVTT